MKNQKGQTLIEALVALGAAVVVITAITIAAIFSLNNTQFNSNANLASHYAQEGIAFARHRAQANWSKFKTYQGEYCYDNDATELVLKGVSTCALSQATVFTRVLTIDQTGGVNCESSAYVMVKVSWRDGSCVDPLLPYCHNVNLETCLSNVNAISLP